VEEFFLQHANLACVEAVEAADGVDVLRERGSGHVRSSFEWPEGGLPVSVDPIVDRVKYRRGARGGQTVEE
jgi:hypothetical protein